MSGDWPSGWRTIDDAEARRAFRAELESELSEGHILMGVALEPIARVDGRDDYLFQAPDGRVAEVHLTFANRPELPPWPGATLHMSLEDWRKAAAAEDDA